MITVYQVLRQRIDLEAERFFAAKTSNTKVQQVLHSKSGQHMEWITRTCDIQQQHQPVQEKT